MSEVMKPDPIAWVYQNANTEHQYLVWHKQEGGRNWTPLFTLQDVQDAILAEREACAKVCDVLAVHPEYASDITKVAAQAIRARGER
jgi:hypothetical protein